MNTCLVEELNILKSSSKEAVENLDSFSPFKEYMHVERDIQGELYDLINKSAESSHSQLLLVCGGVGDGKSHLISYLKHHHNSLFEQFHLHNDATESFDPQKTSMDTLNDVLDQFSDEKLGKDGAHKLILAINLGTLNNFLESKYKERFTMLRKYVSDHNILESIVSHSSFQPESYFQSINFTDYHMFILTPNGPKSGYVQSIIQKVVQKSENNPFYNAYKRSCENCPTQDQCPVKSNYELLQNEKIQIKLIHFIIEVILKFKLIISTRDLLNFIHDIITGGYNTESLENDLNDGWNKKNINNMMSALYPMSIFEHKDLSVIYTVMSKLDPVDIRNDLLDQEIINFYAENESNQFFEQYFDMEQMKTVKQILLFMDQLKNEVKTITQKNQMQTFILKLFIRLYAFCEPKTESPLGDPIYAQYVEDLYYRNRQDKKNLKTLYKKVEEAIYRWAGSSSNNTITLKRCREPIQVKISKTLEVKPYVTDLNLIEEEELHRFVPQINISYIRKGSSEPIAISIDYSLYKFIHDLHQGYRPNKDDYRDFVNFLETIRILGETGDQPKELFFEEKMQSGSKKYRLIYDEDFEEYEFEELQDEV